VNPIVFPRRCAFTRSELVVVVLIVATVIGLLIPAAVQRPCGNAARSQSANNLKQMSLAVANLAGQFNGRVPAGYGPFPDQAGPARGFFYHILPFIEQDSVFRYPPLSSPIKTYAAPNDPTNPGNTAANSYALNARAFGGFCPNGPVVTYPHSFNLKGTSNTVLAIERYARLNGSWPGAPADNADGSCVLYGPHTDIGGAVKDPTFGLPDTNPSCSLTGNGYSPTGLQIALADGSARTVAPMVTLSPNPPIGTTVWGWAISVTGPDDGLFGKAKEPADW
jgi:hypothetical protein